MSGTDRDKFLASLEGWFNGAMDWASGWYTRRTQIFLLVYAAVLTLALNVDSVNLAQSLYRSGSLSVAVANVAGRPAMCPMPSRRSAMPSTSACRSAG